MYKTAIVGGTFDGLHHGHEAMLRTAFASADKVIIGLTSDNYVKSFKPLPDEVTKYDIRQKNLLDWLDKESLSDRVEIVALNDPFEPAISHPEAEVLIVSEQTHPKAIEINHKREERGLSPLELVVIPMVLAYDGSPISSTRLRNGEIDGKGDRQLPEILRPILKNPIGKLLTDSERIESLNKNKDKLIIAVGDIATHTIIEYGFVPRLSIIDLTVRRVKYDTLSFIPPALGLQIIHVVSGPGHISKQAETAISTALASGKKTIIVVEGEEDLLTLSAIELSPLGSIVYYGQPPMTDQVGGPPIQGLVEVEVTAEKKLEIKKILDQFV